MRRKTADPMLPRHPAEEPVWAVPPPVLSPELLVPAVWARPLAPPRSGRPPRLWLARVETLRDVVAPLAESVLDSGERARAAALRSAADRDGYRVAHIGLRLLLGACLGIEPANVPLVRQPCPMCQAPHGRPAVPGADLCFSLSRSGGLCLLAFAATAVGADIEQLPASDVVDDVGAMLHRREAAELAACPPERRPAAFARTWARKEAYLKGLGTGLGRDLCLDHLSTSPHAPSRVPGWVIHDVAAGPDHAAAVAVAEAPPSV
ncbi:4'-phosphopantetheinyl transferase superfamily protein [Streptomyces sp. PSKA30]|uniref:4'-phosphopantetheinyl transferase family protein n=1 Tax=Streptomyces sp. PSKA30 TaxID=2874597 RepID=UPI001CD0EEB9|nr:4'-phosphopantetheinyl transferase superfamily protein [Streptomyces sp. PSKA30]MBZ9640969.1 4'-phosphopantetheinyl transferase superfamily protein [Streptomyces sp. PSKA30]